MDDRPFADEPRGIRFGRARELGRGEFAKTNVLRTAESVQSSNPDPYFHLKMLDAERAAPILGLVDQWSDEPVEAFGEKLFTNGLLGADLLVVPPGAKFPTHVHPGHHLLLALSPGTFSLDGEVHVVSGGDLYMVEGGVPHAVGNPNDRPHVLVAIGAPPKELDAQDRMVEVDWHGTPVQVDESMLPSGGV